MSECQQIVDGDDDVSIKSGQYLYSESLDINEIQFSQGDTSIVKSNYSPSQKESYLLPTSSTEVLSDGYDDISGHVNGRSILFRDSSQNEECFQSDDPIGHDVMLSQGDQVLRSMNECGELTEVVGSESILTQELLSYHQLSQNFHPPSSRSQSPCALLEGEQSPTSSSYPVSHYISSGKNSFSIPNYKSTVSNMRTQNHIDHNLDSLLTAVHIVGSPENAFESRSDTVGSENTTDDAERFPSEVMSIAVMSPLPSSRTLTRKTDVETPTQVAKQTKKRRREKFPTVGCTKSSPGVKVTAKKINLVTSDSNGPDTLTRQLRSGRTTTIEFPSNSILSAVQVEVEENKTACNNRTTNEDEDDIQIAHEAAALASRALKDPGLSSRLLLSLILTREKPGQKSNEQEVKIPEALEATAEKPYYMPAGFQWCEYPPLEDILKKNRRRYYELSMDPTLRQTVEQLSFNNRLVALVRQVGAHHHWIFHHTSTTNTSRSSRRSKTKAAEDETTTETSVEVCEDPKKFVWTEKLLRDRIRFYYKTNLQNARGRLQTMLKNPSKKSNAKHLKELYRLLQENCDDQKN